MSKGWLIAGAVASLMGAGPTSGFQVFNSKTNSAADREPVGVPNGGSANLNIWIDTKEGGTGNATAGPDPCSGSTCPCAGPGSLGDYSCAWDLQFTTTGNLQITGFTPQAGQAADYVVMNPMTFPTTSLRMNGGKPAGPTYEIDEVRIGTLHVSASGPNGQVLMSSGSSVDTQLNLVTISGTPTLLGAACGTGTTDADCDTVALPPDNCPFYATLNTADADGDGRGNACECTDQNGDGSNTVQDLIAINSAIFNPSLVTQLCDGNNDGACNVNDIIAANIEIFSPTSTSTCGRQPNPGP
jgi:hypothetical protein